MAEEFNADALLSQAHAGNADAQYRLAALLMGEQRGDDALTWLRKAASNNHKDARFTLANFYMRGHLVPRDPKRAADMIIQLHEHDYGAASQMLSTMLASGYCVERNWEAALDILLDSAKKDRVGAIREMALLLILADRKEELSHNMLMAMATRGDIHSAMVLAHRCAKGDERIDPSLATNWCISAHERGHPIANIYRDQLNAEPMKATAKESAIPSFDASEIKKILLKESGGKLPKEDVLFDRPTVKTFKKLVPIELCHHLIGMAAPGLMQASVINPETGKAEADPQKNCLQRIFLPVEMDLTTHAVSVRMAASAGTSIDKGEYLSVLLYMPGQSFVPHIDAFEGSADNNPDMARGGQRVKTVLLYLNDGYEGGETHFCTISEKIIGEEGQAIVLHNVLEDGTVDDQSVHESFTVTDGGKWIASLYLRENTFVY